MTLFKVSLLNIIPPMHDGKHFANLNGLQNSSSKWINKNMSKFADGRREYYNISSPLIENYEWQTHEAHCGNEYVFCCLGSGISAGLTSLVKYSE